MQVPPQARCPTIGHWHFPLTHMASDGQTLPHSPQWLSLVSVFTQVPPHTSLGALHGPAPPAPPAPVVVVELVVVVVAVVVVVVVEPELELVAAEPSQVQLPKDPSSRQVCEPTVPPGHTHDVVRPTVHSSLAQPPSCVPTTPNTPTAPTIQARITAMTSARSRTGPKRRCFHRRGFVPIHPSHSPIRPLIEAATQVLR
jgi:hypothetical protein